MWRSSIAAATTGRCRRLLPPPAAAHCVPRPLHSFHTDVLLDLGTGQELDWRVPQAPQMAMAPQPMAMAPQPMAAAHPGMPQPPPQQ